MDVYVHVHGHVYVDGERWRSIDDIRSVPRALEWNNGEGSVHVNVTVSVNVNVR